MGLKQKLSSLFAHDKRHKTQKLWIALSLAYEILRAIAVNFLFAKHGVNAWAYLGLGIITTIIFSITSFRLVTAYIDKQPTKVLLFSVLSTIFFFAPDIYIFASGENVPKQTYVIFFIYLSITTIFTIKSLVNDTRN